MIRRIFNWTFSSFFRTLGRFLFYILIGVLAYFCINGFPKVKAGSIVVGKNSDILGTWLGNSNEMGGYRQLYNINGSTSFAYGTGSFIYVNGITLSVIGASVGNNVNYIIELQICQTGNDYNLNWDAGSVFTQVNSITTLRQQTIGTCSVNNNGANLINYYILVSGNVISYPNPESSVGFNGQSFVLRFNLPYKEWSIKNVQMIAYSSELYNSIVQGKELEEIKEQMNKTQQETNNKLDTNNQLQQETNDKLNDLNDNITNSDTSGAQNNANSFFSDFDSNDYGLTDVISMPLNVIKNITSSKCTPLSIPIPFVDTNVTLPCMNTIYSQFFGDVLTIYQTITTGMIAYWVCINIFAMVKGFKDPDSDNVEVMEL